LYGIRHSVEELSATRTVEMKTMKSEKVEEKELLQEDSRNDFIVA